jgi:polysaccharide chain length determinant protein (PEP-CTERM system associated)
MPPTQHQTDVGFSLGDLVAIFRRRILWFGVPTAAGLLIAAGVALGLPAVYEASTTILIEPSSIREDIVASTVVADKEARFQQTRLRLLARDALAQIITQFELYGDDSVPMEGKVEEMRGDVRIEPIIPEIVDPRHELEVNSVRIAYRDSVPERAANVANSLAREFIRVNIEARAADAQGTSDFLKSELAREEGELGKILAEISDYKAKNDGELPDQLMQNRTTLDRLQRDLAEKQADLELARGQVALIQRQMAELRVGGGGEETPMKRKQSLESALTSYRANGLTDRHPDVIAAMTEIAELERKIAEASAAETPSGTRPATSPTEARLSDELRHFQVKVNVAAIDVDRISQDLTTYETRLANTPRHQAELDQLEARAYSHEQAIQEFRRKKALADIAKSMESKQRGERYRVIESAQPPERPVEPNRPLLFAIGAVLGLAAGLTALVIRELSDARLHTVEDLQAVVPLPVLASVPVIRLPAEIAEMRARLRRFGLSSAAALLATVIVGGAVWLYTSASPETPTEAPTEAAPEAPQQEAPPEAAKGDV